MTKRKLDLLPKGHGGEAKPTLELMRRRLGGPREAAGVSAREGTVAVYRGLPALVLYEDPENGRVDLWLGEGRAVRANADELSPAPLEAPTELPVALSRTADDLRVFLHLQADARVRFLAGDGRIREGKLIERCRFGGLVALDEGTVLGVGFSRFLPLASTSVLGARPS